MANSWSSGSALVAVPLTAQQQAIVAHTYGPAIVLAVAGSGKTTAMVHRVARLVAENIYAPNEILAASFNRDANEEIRAALANWPGCADVHVRTLHSLALAILTRAQRRGHLSGIDLDRSASEFESAPPLLLAEALSAAPTSAFADLDRQRFLTYVSVCKGNLVYPNGLLDTPRARELRRPPPGDESYARLYALYEAARVQRGIVTFDDLTPFAWHALETDPSLLVQERRRYACVLVDEFQDLNLAQIEMLDLLTSSHRNYMAIGDDDQTIYEWRGADARRFLNFRSQGGSLARATIYRLSENFRSRAAQVVLANQVIRHNRARHPKQMQLTRGFGGTVRLQTFPDHAAQAHAIAARIAKGLASGANTPGDFAVLVRLYAQTPPIEAALGAAGIPFRVGDSAAQLKRARGAPTPANQDPPAPPQSVTITSIFRAKGLEWPVVFVPDCNDGVLPLSDTDNLEQERRLLYVAITRAREELYLFSSGDRPLSPFLSEANAETLVEAVGEIAYALETEPTLWGRREYAAVTLNAHRLDLFPYFAHWWDAAPESRSRVARAVLSFYRAAQEKGLLRRMGIGRAEISLWSALASSRRASRSAEPLRLPDLEPLFEQFYAGEPRSGAWAQMARWWRRLVGG